VAFCGEINNGMRMVIEEDLPYQPAVTNVALNKLVARMVGG
jgi:hypothetical protein